MKSSINIPKNYKPEELDFCPKAQWGTIRKKFDILEHLEEINFQLDARRTPLEENLKF